MPNQDTANQDTAAVVASLLHRFGVATVPVGGDNALLVHSPIDGQVIGAVRSHTAAEVNACIADAYRAFTAWRVVPGPKRGELIRLFGDELRANKEALGRLVTLETGKILTEGYGEVQEMIDVCDFAVGQSRQLHGVTIASERPGHRMMETWHPLGVVGVISAFNFPVAVWAWNFALAVVCGNAVVWKPSEKTPLTALVCQALFARALACFRREQAAPDGLSAVVQGASAVGEALVDHPQVALVSATGSTRMGREVGPRLAARFGRSLLELGGNNAVVVTPTADIDLAIPGVLFAAVGTAGQRCTSTRRLIVHEDIYDQLFAGLRRAYLALRVGNPLLPTTLVGPLIDRSAFDAMQRTLVAATQEGGTVYGGERIAVPGAVPALDGGSSPGGSPVGGGYYVRPALVEMPGQTETVRQECFAPILYLMRYAEFEKAIALHNDVPQGLSSAIFTNDVREAETFLSATGSDCGIANVNIGTSGAEIGGAFGGEKETGGGRESGSDAWRAYMRRATNTVNYSRELPLAQGVRFQL